MTAHYFLGTSLLGSTEAHQTWDSLVTAPSIAYFCSTCGELWGRAINEGQRCWQILVVGCTRHPMWSFEPGGSFLRSWHLGHIDELPESVLRREFALHWQHYVGVRL